MITVAIQLRTLIQLDTILDKERMALEIIAQN